MGVFTFLCRSSDDEWTAKQLNGELEWSAGSTFELQRKLVHAALSADSSGAIQSSFPYVTPSSAVFQVIVGSAVVGGALIGGGAVPGAASDAEEKKEPAAEETNKEKEIEPRRTYNFENMLSEMKIPLHGLLNSVLALEETTLDVDQVEYLIKLCTTDEKMELLKRNKEKLGKREQVSLELMQVPRVESMLRALSFKIWFRSEVSGLRNRLNVVNSAADQIRGSAKFKEIMKKIVWIGTVLKQETQGWKLYEYLKERGCFAIRLRLESLLELTETRAGNYTSLMHFFCKRLADKTPELLDFWKELPDMEPASKLQLRFLAEKKQAISEGLEKVKQDLSMSENDDGASKDFCKAWNEFLCSAKEDITMLDSHYSRVVSNADAVIRNFGQDPTRCPFEQVTSTLVNFVRMFKQAHDENSKQLECQ